LNFKTRISWPYFLSGRYEEAIEKPDEVLEMDPNYKVAHYNLAMCYMYKGFYDGIEGMYEKLRKRLGIRQ
jgi:tetratricopeptide (TPR) repeat protein